MGRTRESTKKIGKNRKTLLTSMHIDRGHKKTMERKRDQQTIKKGGLPWTMRFQWTDTNQIWQDSLHNSRE